MRISDWSSDVCSSDLCCGGALHCIDSDISSRLDVIPVQYRVIVTSRPRMACRACSDGVFQAPAPKHIVPGGLPTEALIADVLVRKNADHTPFYRQAQALRRQGIEIDRSEEPTSELESLIRISYAVLYLKKSKT